MISVAVCGDVLELARLEPPVVADDGRADELADLLRVLGRDLGRDLLEEPADEPASVLERRQLLLLGPVAEAADPELVVLVEAAVRALREVVAPPRQPLLESRELLLAVDVGGVVLRAHLVLEVGEVLLPLVRCRRP